MFKNCHHQVEKCVAYFFLLQVISASKLTMRKESTRDHVDLLQSSKHWPLVCAVDMACDVVAHVEVREPKLANAITDSRGGRRDWKR